MSDSERAADLDQASLEVYVEEAVDDRVDCAVEQRQRLDRRVDGVGDRMAVLGPDVEQMDGEVRSPAADERSDDAQSHLHKAAPCAVRHAYKADFP